MAYDRSGRDGYALESAGGSPFFFAWLLIVGGLLVVALVALFVIGPGQYMDEREFVVSLAFIFGGLASLTGAFILGIQHAARPRIINQPEALTIDVAGSGDRRIHVEGHAFPIGDVRSIQLQRSRIQQHDAEGSTELVSWIVAIVLRDRAVELSFRDREEAARRARELAEQLGARPPELRERGTPMGPVLVLLGALVIIGAVVALFWTANQVLLAHNPQPLHILRVAGYVGAITPATYVVARLVGKLAAARQGRALYGIQ